MTIKVNVPFPDIVSCDPSPLTSICQRTLQLELSDKLSTHQDSGHLHQSQIIPSTIRALQSILITAAHSGATIMSPGQRVQMAWRRSETQYLVLH